MRRKIVPANSILKFYRLPAICAAMEIHRNNAGKAIEMLEPAASYELGEPQTFLLGTLYPAYLRGEAYLQLGKANEAESEFRKLIDHHGIVLNFPLGALAHLGLARAYGLSGDAAKARLAYQDFLALWKDADPDIPILWFAKSPSAAGFNNIGGCHSQATCDSTQPSYTPSDSLWPRFLGSSARVGASGSKT